MGAIGRRGLAAQNKSKDRTELVRDHRTPSPITEQRTGFTVELS
jgi:hypothetical protein